MIQNMGCRVIRNLKKHDHVSNAVREIQSFGNYVSMYQWFGPIISDKPAGPEPNQKTFEIRHSRKTSNTLL